MQTKRNKQLVRRKPDGSTVVVTPVGNYTQPGDYGNNEDLIPKGASEPIKVRSSRINEQDARRDEQILSLYGSYVYGVYAWSWSVFQSWYDCKISV